MDDSGRTGISSGKAGISNERIEKTAKMFTYVPVKHMLLTFLNRKSIIPTDNKGLARGLFKKVF